jgi:peptidoglycan/LPS O-acetylase OafA/YrhL
MAGSLADVFDRRANGLNLLRLVLAAGVIVWHSFPLTGHDIGWPPARQLMSSIWVDGFFAISGFLIAGSWLGRPDLLIFLRARMLRLLPGFYVCILFTAFILAPLMVWLTGAGGPISFAESWAYVRANGLLWVTSYDIGGSPEGIPYPNVWNGSLWTLAWEGLCYLGVAVLGILGLLRRRWVAPALLGVVMLITILIAAGWTVNGLIGVGTRFAIMFLAGVTVQLFADQIPG